MYVAKATENNGCQSTGVPLRPFNAELGSHPGVICTHTDVIIWTFEWSPLYGAVFTYYTYFCCEEYKQSTQLVSSQNVAHMMS